MFNERLASYARALGITIGYYALGIFLLFSLKVLSSGSFAILAIFGGTIIAALWAAPYTAIGLAGVVAAGHALKLQPLKSWLILAGVGIMVMILFFPYFPVRPRSFTSFHSGDLLAVASALFCGFYSTYRYWKKAVEPTPAA